VDGWHGPDVAGAFGLAPRASLAAGAATL